MSLPVLAYASRSPTTAPQAPASPEAVETGIAIANPDSLVDTGWVVQHLDHDYLIACDVRSAQENADLDVRSARGGHIRGTHTWFVLKELPGYPDVTIYDSSWKEWGNAPDTPIE